jgi:hypothetical protein
VIAVLSIFLVCGGGGVAAHTISDLETGHPGHSRPAELTVLGLSALVFLLGVLPLLATRS